MRPEIEAFIRAIVAAILAAEARGIATPAALADHLNAEGITTRRGRRWNAATVGKFLASPGARRFRCELSGQAGTGRTGHGTLGRSS